MFVRNRMENKEITTVMKLFTKINKLWH